MSMYVVMGRKFMRSIPFILNENEVQPKFVLRIVSLLALCKR